KSEREDRNIHSLISLVVEIAYRNPRVSPTAITILTFLINQIEDDEEKGGSIKRIKNKFLQIPNSSLLKVWLQRLFLKLDDTLEYDEPLCQKVLSSNVQVWNTDWLNPRLRGIIERVHVVNYESIAKLKEVATEDEIKAIIEIMTYDFQEE